MEIVKQPIRLLFLDDKAGEEDRALFGQDCSENPLLRTDLSPPLELRSSCDAETFLEQLTRGENWADALLLDIDFLHLQRPELKLVDPPCSPKQRWGVDILRTVKRIDPDFPVVVLTVLPDQDVSFAAGRFGAYDFLPKARLSVEPQQGIRELHARISSALEICEQRAVYDHEHLAIANDFARTYDTEERRKCATVAYYHFENEWIDRLVERLLPEKGRLRVLDVGCGTGRVEEFLARSSRRGRIEVVGIDFSGRMLAYALEKLKGEQFQNLCCVKLGEACDDEDDGLLHASLFRAPAENLAFLTERYPTGFHLVILGFGLLSYVRYGAVLPPAIEEPALTGVLPLLINEGKLLFSVYNEDSDIYRRVEAGDYDRGEIPIAALMDLKSGRLQVGEHKIQCEPFTRPRILRFLRQAGFEAKGDVLRTFPTLHLGLRNSEASTYPEDPEFPGGRFNSALYTLDRALSAVLPDRGHYLVGEASKRSGLNQRAGL